MSDSDLVRLQFTCSLEKSAFPVEQLSPASLAYIGDAVYELYIRTRCLWPPKKISLYHDQVVSKVRAETQAAYLGQLVPYLTEAEQEILKKGRNGVKREPKRISAKLYQEASSLETLIGYLYLSNPQRLDQLLEKLKFD